MRYTGKEARDKEISSLRDSLEAVLKGLGFILLELVVSKHRGSVQVKAVIFNGGSIGTDDCSLAHRTISPRLDIAYSGLDIYLEVSSPGVERLIKDGAEFAFYKGMGVRCYCTDRNEWVAGILESADENGITVNTNKGAENAQLKQRLNFDIIAKAKLDGSLSVTKTVPAAKAVNAPSQEV